MEDIYPIKLNILKIFIVLTLIKWNGALYFNRKMQQMNLKGDQI
jgi:hypothetical protein